MQLLLLLLLSLQVPLVASQTACGVTHGSNCTDPSAPCCSKYSYCGNTPLYCGTSSCQPDYSVSGACGTNTSSSSAPAPANLAVTPAAPGPSSTAALLGRCGIDPSNRSTNYGKCQFTNYCCSPFGYCGIDEAHCVGCQKDFGYCPAVCDPAKPCGALGWTTLILSVLSLPFTVGSLIFQLYKYFRPDPKESRYEDIKLQNL